MPTDPYVPPDLDDARASSRTWRPACTAAGAAVAGRPPRRPGRGPADGELLGSPGPDVGYALSSPSGARDRFVIAPDEPCDDAGRWSPSSR